MPDIAGDLARRLADNAEAFCREYLSNGRLQGRYWLVGDIDNSPGRSLFVRLFGPRSGRGAAGKWTDASTGERGDLLDVIRARGQLREFRDVANEARRFLRMPRPDPPARARDVPRNSPEAARRLFAMSRPIAATIADAYLRRRAITSLYDVASLRFHPSCFYRPDCNAPSSAWPAMIAGVTDLRGALCGVHRTWLTRGGDKAPVETPRRALGDLLGHAVRFGTPHDIMAAGEGIETLLSLRMVLPTMPMAAGLSAAHLASIHFPRSLRRLYIAKDRDAAGERSTGTLIERADACGIEPVVLLPLLGDFNDDLRESGVAMLRADVLRQVRDEDVERFADREDLPPSSSTPAGID